MKKENILKILSLVICTILIKGGNVYAKDIEKDGIDRIISNIGINRRMGLKKTQLHNACEKGDMQKVRLSAGTARTEGSTGLLFRRSFI